MEQEPTGVLIVTGLSRDEIDKLASALERCEAPDEYLDTIESVMRAAKERGIDANIEYFPLINGTPPYTL